VKTAGFSVGSASGLLIFAFVLGLTACSEPTPQAFFCETTPQAGDAQPYKQLIVSFSNDAVCLQGPDESKQCAKPNQPQATPWQDLDAQTQRRDIIKVKMTKDLVLMDLQKESRLSAPVQTPSETTSTNARYEFSKKDKTLIVTTQEQEISNVFTCKPWVQRSWWQLY